MFFYDGTKSVIVGVAVVVGIEGLDLALYVFI
jgi:hypothetical protein